MKFKFKEVNGLKIRYAEQRGNQKETVVMLSPWPQSIMAFEPFWDKLTEEFSVIAIDLPGYGGSEGDIKYFSPLKMADCLVDIVNALEIPKFHLVGPDVGCPAGLALAIKKPELLKSLFIGDGACVSPLIVASSLEQLIKAPSLEDLKPIANQQLVMDTVKRGYLKHQPSEEAVNDFLASYDTTERIVEPINFVRAYPVDLPEMQKKYGDIEIPVMIAWGENDVFALKENAFELDKMLKNSQVKILEGAGHFAYEDNNEEVLELFKDWFNKNA
ncbi:alpha/beta hydrolase [Wukongibacter baidiensis]|uniref:alpha/beta fold hydrolase n=1 Tax=Wukongibacter baidiensis TaxID=1723361 RepID=UPI003D7F5735